MKLSLKAIMKMSVHYILTFQDRVIFQKSQVMQKPGIIYLIFMTIKS